MKKIDDIFTWIGWGNGFGKWDSKCRVRVYEHDERVVCLATELEDNTGTSITNCAEFLCVLVINKYELDMKKVTWIEHYPKRDDVKAGFGKKPTIEESFSIVGFNVAPGPPNLLTPKARTVMLVDPVWKAMKKNHIESLIGEPVGD